MTGRASGHEDGGQPVVNNLNAMHIPTTPDTQRPMRPESRGSARDRSFAHKLDRMDPDEVARVFDGNSVALFGALVQHLANELRTARVKGKLASSGREFKR